MVPSRKPGKTVSTSSIGWTAVVPVKDFTVAKSRLPYPPAVRAALALAMAEDVVAVLLTTPAIRRVVVVTDDPAAREAFGSRAIVVPDEPRAGLSAALAHAASIATARWPMDGVLTVAADLPALTSTALMKVLAEGDGTHERFVVADAAGIGTTLLAAAPGVSLDPRFEGGSLAAHVGAGAHDVTAAATAGVRWDIDTSEDIAAVVQLGTGPNTLRVLREHGITS